MSTPPHRVVYVCNVILQAVLSGDGPAFRCLCLVEQKHVELLVSESVTKGISLQAALPESEAAYVGGRE